MATAGEQIRSADAAICRNIEALADQRGLLSQNVISQLRNLVEGVAVCLHAGTPNAEFNYPAIDPALAFVKSKAKFNFLGKFHRLIQQSASHYTFAEDASERLMLKYFEFLYRTRALLRTSCGISALTNLEDFPIDLDPSLREYHQKIAAKIKAPHPRGARDRYYIHRTRPFFLDGVIYYEVTFYRAINNVNKFDRLIAFTDIDIVDNYSAHLTLQADSIEVLGQKMPITIIRDWAVSIRPCELKNFARLLGISLRDPAGLPEYMPLMRGLTTEWDSLLDLVDMPERDYNQIKAKCSGGKTSTSIFSILDRVRQIVGAGAPGHNVLRYLMLQMRNQILKEQYWREPCASLSGMNLKYGCIPFDTMPFCTSLPGHNPRYSDLAASLNVSGREHELYARRVKNNVEREGILYTPESDLEVFGDGEKLVSTYNGKLYYKHMARRLLVDKGHVFIREYEDDTVAIVRRLQEVAATGIAGYPQAIERWLNEAPRSIDDPVKTDALKRLFAKSRVALIYGAAGTGKSTMVDHVAHYFNDKKKLFLAHTHPATANLKRRVTAQHSDFRTISSHIYRDKTDEAYDLLVIDECSTVSNSDLKKVLEKTSFRLLVLVGDVYQIESIQFGNWFEIIRSFIPQTSIFELTTPFRTKNKALLSFWDKVRTLDEDIAEAMARNGYSTVLDKTLFESQGRDEIILCLNYDGLYGINNINRFLQSSNPGEATTWRVSTYKVGDPVIFFETERFKPVIYNNLKGRIVAIRRVQGGIKFDIDLDRPVSEFDTIGTELEWVEGSTVRFFVSEHDASDEDDDSQNTTVPFQVAYAVSIHKAQGLEYDSVKVVITDANEDDISHSIFYTAVTRARERLRIFWTPETQQGVLKQLRRSADRKDVALLSARHGLSPVS